jgi:hypothetical protein
MNIVIANILSKTSMKNARAAIHTPLKLLLNSPERSVKSVFQNSYVHINYTLQQLDMDDKIGTYLSKRDVKIILEKADEELKTYRKIGNFYVKWCWSWNTDHTIILLFVLDFGLHCIEYLTKH